MDQQALTPNSKRVSRGSRGALPEHQVQMGWAALHRRAASVDGIQSGPRVGSVGIALSNSGRRRGRTNGPAKLTQVRVLSRGTGSWKRAGRGQGSRLLCKADRSAKGLPHHQRSDQRPAPVGGPHGHSAPLGVLLGLASSAGLRTAGPPDPSSRPLPSHTSERVTSMFPRVALL